MIDEDNDTVTVGLPYEEALPTAVVTDVTTTVSSLTCKVDLTDADGLATKVGGWLRAVVCDRENAAVAQQKLTLGASTVTFTGLSADTYYNVHVVLYGDLHDGEGVRAHTLTSEMGRTANVISSEIKGELLLNEQTGKYYPAISVVATLGDASFTFTKIEVSTWEDGVLFSGAFDGEIVITDNLAPGNSYLIKVYYKNAAGIEQFYEDNVYVEGFEYPWVREPSLAYGLVDDAVLGFDLGENKCNFENLKLVFFSEHSAQYIAEDALALLENSNLITELREQWSTMDRTADGWFELGQRIDRLELVEQDIEDYYSTYTKQDWEREKAKGKYAYELVYGEDDEFFRGEKNKYYVVLKDYQSKRVDDGSWEYRLTADFEHVNGPEYDDNHEIVHGWVDIKPALTKNDYLFDEEFSIDAQNVVYLEVKSRNNLGNESYRELGYVNQIVLADGYEILAVLWTQDEPEHAIDEAAWLAAVINALKTGADVQSVFPLGELKPITFDMDDVDIDPSIAGNFNIRFTYKMYGKTYDQEHPYDWSGATVDYKVIGQLPKASVSIKTTATEDYGTYRIVIPSTLDGGYWRYYTIEIKDENGNPVGTYNQGNVPDRLSAGQSIRIKLTQDPNFDYYLDGEWSEWFVCERAKLSAPTGFAQSLDGNGVTLTWQWVDGAEKYVYVINDGAETELTGALGGLKNGDKVKVKAVPAEGGNYLESDYSEVYTVTDTRTKLATPINLRTGSKLIMWDSVDNATYYEIAFVRNGVPITATSYGPEYHATIGMTYRVRACNDDVSNYIASEWSESYTYTVTLAEPSFDQIRSGRVYWNAVENAGGYNYRIGENGTVSSTRSRYVALSEIPVGEKLYVQAYAEGCESTAWVMIYHNVTVLATPTVTVTGGTASWTAVENATGFAYKLNDGAEQTTTATSVSGLVAGDRIVVRATTTAFGYTDSEWSEERTQLPTMSAPVVDTTQLATAGIFSWEAVDGAAYYIYEIDGVETSHHESGNRSISGIADGAKIRIRAVCESGEYDPYGAWSDYYTRVDTRQQLATPVIAYDPETGLTVVVGENVSHYVYKMGSEGWEQTFYLPDGALDVEVIATTLMFAGPDTTIYVKAVPADSTQYRESEWATLTVTFG